MLMRMMFNMISLLLCIMAKASRGVVMCRISPVNWMDLWLRLSTIYYTNKYIGSGWDEIEGNRQNEIEIQVRINVPG